MTITSLSIPGLISGLYSISMLSGLRSAFSQLMDTSDLFGVDSQSLNVAAQVRGVIRGLVPSSWPIKVSIGPNITYPVIIYIEPINNVWVVITFYAPNADAEVEVIDTR
jgi:hypothetical protein